MPIATVYPYYDPHSAAEPRKNRAPATTTE